jgi:uncharacterized membrane protein YfcA
MDILLIAVIIFFACFTQSVTGFGLALVAMPLLVEQVGIHIAAPLVALIGTTNSIGMLIRYRRSLSLRAVWRLALTSLIGIPLGVFALSQINETTVRLILGLVVVGYAGYALLAPTIPRLKHTGWAYGMGLCSGVLAGAYNTGGPPLIIYASAQDWEAAEFKGNLQSLALFNSVMVILTHALGGSFTGLVWQRYLIALPAIAIGLLAGVSLD